MLPVIPRTINYHRRRCGPQLVHRSLGLVLHCFFLFRHVMIPSHLWNTTWCACWERWEAAAAGYGKRLRLGRNDGACWLLNSMLVGLGVHIGSRTVSAGVSA